MAPTPLDAAALVAHLSQRNVGRTCSLLEARAREGDFASLLAVAEAAGQEAHRRPESAGELVSVIRHLDEVIALHPGMDAARAAVMLVQRVAPSPRRTRRLAAMLAQTHPLDTLVTLAAAPDPGLLDLLGAWMHELVLRGAADGADAASAHPLAELDAHLRRAGHPLAWLPGARSEMERAASLNLASYSIGSSGCVHPSRRWRPSASAGRPLPEGFAPREITTDEVSERLAAAPAIWDAESNGSIEARVFDLGAPVSPEHLGVDLVRALPLASTAGELTVVTIEAHQALGLLFFAAAQGGAYGSGHDGAWGRLLAWRSLGALAGAPPEASWSEVERAARACTWLDIDGSEWFHHVAWDLGYAVLRRDGTMAVLAATDTD